MFFRCSPWPADESIVSWLTIRFRSKPLGRTVLGSAFASFSVVSMCSMMCMRKLTGCVWMCCRSFQTAPCVYIYEAAVYEEIILLYLLTKVVAGRHQSLFRRVTWSVHISWRYFSFERYSKRKILIFIVGWGREASWILQETLVVSSSLLELGLHWKAEQTWMRGGGLGQGSEWKGAMRKWSVQSLGGQPI